MRFFIKILITLVVLAILLPFTLLKGKDGRPLMSLDKLKTPDISVPRLPTTGLGSDDGNKDLIYRWTDREGVIHFTNTPPPRGVEYTVKGYDPNTNLIQSVKLPQAEEPPERKPVQAATKQPPGSLREIGNPYSVEKVEKLMEDARNVQKLLEDRLERQEELIQGQ
jgi:hypothetical protein